MIAYIDESGDEGTDGKGSRWLILGCAMVSDSTLVATRDNVRLASTLVRRDNPKNLHFKDLSHDDRLGAISVIKGGPSHGTIVVSDTTKIQQGSLLHKPIYQFNYAARYVVERVSKMATVLQEPATVYFETRRNFDLHHFLGLYWARRPKRGDTPPMSKESIGSRSESRPEWEHLEDWVQGQVQRLIQDLLEQEVTEFLGRARSVRRADSDSDTGYRNGYAPPRKLTLSSGTIHLRRPRVRDTEERFESRLLPLFVHRTRKVADLISDLYLHGLSEGDFDLALRGLLGEEAPVSASTVARLKERWNAELAQWRARPLDDLEVVYMWVDGVYVKAGFEKDKAAVKGGDGGPE